MPALVPPSVPRPEVRPPRRACVAPLGFTLVELVTAMTVIGFIAGVVTLALPGVVRANDDAVRRALIASDLGFVLRSMTAEMRSALPNSVRSPGSGCIEFIPASAGGAYRRAPDTTIPGSAWADTSAAITGFDVLSSLASTPAVGDWIVIANASPAGVYASDATTSRARITGVSVPAAALGTARLAFTSLSVPTSYDAGRFAIVSDSVQAVTYFCDGTTGSTDGAGNAGGRLMRRSRYGFVAAAPGACPTATSAPDASVVVDKVSQCAFRYIANDPSTQQSGWIGARLAVTRGGESATISTGAYLANVP